MSYIEAKSGSTVTLPFHFSSPYPGDSVRLILWFKDSEEKPIYSVDARGSYHSSLSLTKCNLKINL